jgi:uncharacterized protein (TIGR02646 family)
MVHTPRTLPPPPQLVKRGKQWTARFQAIASGSAKGDWATRSAKKVLCAALRGLAYGKCVYCEGALEPQGYVEVDHYVAKTVDRKLVFEWTNLLPACGRCNNPKRAQDHKGALLKPDDEDPEPYFWIHPDTGRLEAHPNLNADQTQRANETIRLCDLQRAALCYERTKMLERVGRWLEQVSVAGHLSDPLRAEWEDLSDPRMEYKFVLRHVLETRGQHELAEFDRMRFTGAHAGK